MEQFDNAKRFPFIFIKSNNGSVQCCCFHVFEAFLKLLKLICKTQQPLQVMELQEKEA